MDIFKPNVKKLKEKIDIIGLIRALGYKKDPIIRATAANALGEMRDEGENDEVVEALILALKDEVDYVRKTAADVLGRIGRPAVESLIKALSDENAQIRKGARGVLWHINWQPKDDIEKAWYLFVYRKWDELKTLRKSAVEPLILALKDEYRRDDRCKAVEALGVIKDKRAIEPLILALRGREDEPPPYIQHLEDDNQSWEVQAGAATALGKIGGKRVIKALIQTCKEDDGTEGGMVQEAAVRGLGKIGGEEVVDDLIWVLGNNNHTSVLSAVAEVLGKIGDERAIEPLIQTLGRIESCVQSAKALGDYLPPGEFEIKREATAALRKIGKPAVEHLIQSLKDKDKDVREAAKEALEEIKKRG